jgi:hypothetical protein
MKIPLEIEKLLSDLLDEMHQILKGNLVGLYLYGSFVAGDFDDHISDLDMLAVTENDIDGTEFEQLLKMHMELIASYPIWDNRIEVQYYSANALKTFKTQRSPIVVISPGEPLNIKDAGLDWLINWYLVLEGGKILYGPGPESIIPPISHEEFLQASRDQALNWADWNSQPRDLKDQSYAILTLCRALYASDHGEQTSKRQAATWAQEQFSQWASLVEDALYWREAQDIDGVNDDAFSADTAEFVHFAIARIVQ